MNHVTITPEAGLQIASHYDVVNEDSIIGIVLSSPQSKRDYYDPSDRTRFSLTIFRKDRRGKRKCVLIRVAENDQLPTSVYQDTEFVVLLVHVTDAERDADLV